jgi:hypothetical protein
MSTWYDLYGTEPTHDRALIEAWAGAGLDLGVVLNELPADGPCHPATLVIAPLALELSCETTGRALVVPCVGAAGARQLELVARTAKAWGCTYLVLTGHRR